MDRIIVDIQRVVVSGTVVVFDSNTVIWGLLTLNIVVGISIGILF